MAPPFNMSSYGDQVPYQTCHIPPFSGLSQSPQPTQMHDIIPRNTNQEDHVEPTIIGRPTIATALCDLLIQEQPLQVKSEEDQFEENRVQITAQQEDALHESIMNADTFEIEDSDYNDYDGSNDESESRLDYSSCFLTGCMVAERVAKRNQHRPCLKNLHHVCCSTRHEMTGPPVTLPNIHAQGVPWATKDFISSYMRLIHSRHLIKGYLGSEAGTMRNIEQEFTKEFRACYTKWEDSSRDLSEHMIRIVSNLDSNVSTPAAFPTFVNHQMEPDDGAAHSELAPHDCDGDTGCECNDQQNYEPPNASRENANTKESHFTDGKIPSGDGDIAAPYKTTEAQPQCKDDQFWQAALTACNSFMNSPNAVKEEFNSGVDWHTWAHNEPTTPQPGAPPSASKTEENSNYAKYQKELEMHKQHLQQLFLQQHIPQQIVKKPYMKQPCPATTTFLEHMRNYAHMQFSGPTNPTGATGSANRCSPQREGQPTNPPEPTGTTPRCFPQQEAELMKTLLVEIKRTDFYIALQKPPTAGKNVIALTDCRDNINAILTNVYNSMSDMVYDLRRLIINAQFKFIKDPAISSQIEKFRAAINI